MRDLLAVLAGRFPNPVAGGEIRSRQPATLPEEIPVSLPSELVAQRPDVLQAEAKMHAANAQIGIAIANRLPNITLTADAGSTALSIDKVFTSGTGFWGHWRGGNRPAFLKAEHCLHQERAAKATAYIQAAEQ